MTINQDIDIFIKKLDNLTIKDLVESKDKLHECLLKLQDYNSIISYPRYFKMKERQQAFKNLKEVST
jgi:predicted nucleotidyltransferase